jgi:hypothetical protein
MKKIDFRVTASAASKPRAENTTIFVEDILVLNLPYQINVCLAWKNTLAFVEMSSGNVPWCQPFQDLQGLLTDEDGSVQLASFIYQFKYFTIHLNKESIH